MAYTYIQFKDKVNEILEDKAEKLTEGEKANFCQEAIKIYSSHRQREVVKDITGDGTYDYLVSSNLTLWIKGFSIIKKLEYPADKRSPVYLEEDDDYIIYEKEAGEYLRLINDVPSTTEKIRVTYTALHIFIEIMATISIASPAVVSLADHKLNPGDKVKFSTTGALPTGITAGTTYYVISAGFTANAFEISATPGGTAINTSGTQSGVHTVSINTIAESDQDAIANLAASLCSGALASIYAHTSDSSITADSVDHRSKAQEFSSRAKIQKQNYLHHIGMKEGEIIPPVSMTKDYDVNYPWGDDRLTHPKKWR